MLRYIISVTLAMTACATLIPTKANAATLTLVPVGSLKRNPGDSIEFVLKFNPSDINTTVTIVNVLTPEFDSNELSFDRDRSTSVVSYPVSSTTTIANFFLTVLPGVVKDGNNDFIRAVVNYEFTDSKGYVSGTASLVNLPFVDVEPVPEPLTILGAATAIGYGALLKRRSSKKTVS
jgi:hypothetical protein